METLSEIGKRIKEKRIELGLTQEELAKRTGYTSRSSINKIELGFVDLPQSKINAIAKALSVSPLYLITGMEQDASNSYLDNIFPISPKRFPLLGDIACGKPIFADEDRESYVLSGTDIKADFCLRCKGDSMIGARILDGDIVFIHEQPIVENGEIAAVIIEDEATLKRVNYYPEKNMLILKAENPKYSDLIYIGEELNTIRILGKAVAFQSDVK